MYKPQLFLLCLIGLDADRESQNSGDEPIDLIWVALKPGCMADT